MLSKLRSRVAAAVAPAAPAPEPAPSPADRVAKLAAEVVEARQAVGAAHDALGDAILAGDPDGATLAYQAAQERLQAAEAAVAAARRRQVAEASEATQAKERDRKAKARAAVERQHAAYARVDAAIEELVNAATDAHAAAREAVPLVKRDDFTYNATVFGPDLVAAIGYRLRGVPGVLGARMAHGFISEMHARVCRRLIAPDALGL